MHDRFSQTFFIERTIKENCVLWRAKNTNIIRAHIFAWKRTGTQVCLEGVWAPGFFRLGIFAFETQILFVDPEMPDEQPEIILYALKFCNQ